MGGIKMQYQSIYAQKRHGSVDLSRINLAWTDAAREASAEARKSHASNLAGSLRSGSFETTHGGKGETVKGGGNGFNDVHDKLKAAGFERDAVTSTPNVGQYKHSDGTTATARKTYSGGNYQHTVVFK